MGRTEGKWHSVFVIVGLIAICQSPAAAQSKWWNPQWNYRIPVTVDVKSVERWDLPVEMEVNFSDFLSVLGEEAAFNVDSLRIVEVDQTMRVIDERVAFQFDRDSSYNSVTRARGTLVWLMKGKSSGRRLFHVYFDTGGIFSPAVVPSQLALTNRYLHEGQESYKVITEQATYIYHKSGASFASIIDQREVDWVGFHRSGKPGSEDRGLPKMGDFGRPGNVNASSRILNIGPVKVSFVSETVDRKSAVEWSVFPKFARMKVLRMEKPYYFGYDGVPAGGPDLRNTYTMNSEGRKIYSRQAWRGALPTPEWIYFGSDKSPRTLFISRSAGDEKSSQFSQVDEQMISFAFGRRQPDGVRLLTGGIEVFTIGIVESSDFSGVSSAIASVTRPITVKTGDPEGRETPFALRAGRPPSITAADTNVTELVPAYLNKPEHRFFAGYCTWYAAKKFKEYTGMPVTWSGDGGLWFDNAAAEGRKVTTNPKDAQKGSLMVWTRGANGKGHVAFVEEVDDGGIYITEMNVRGRWIVSDAYIPFENPDKGTKYRFRGIILPQ